MRRVLIGGCVRQVPEVLSAHLDTLRWQSAEDAEIDFLFVDDNEDAESSYLLASFGETLVAGARHSDEVYAVDGDTHEWAEPTFHRLAREKQRILDHALANGYDAVFLVDSDLLLAPDTLATLLRADRDIVSAVFWTRWSPDDAELPQVWQRHPYGFDGAGWDGPRFLRALRMRQLLRVRGLGACTLISRDALLRGAAFTPALELPSGGMWQGEDRHFCVRAERLGVEMWADAFCDVRHVYRVEDRKRIGAWKAELWESAGERARDGDFVSFTVEACEEPQLFGHRERVRGRLGRMELAPEVERALRTLPVGESAFVRATFDDTHPIAAYRGTQRLLRVTLCGVRSHVDEALPGVRGASLDADALPEAAGQAAASRDEARHKRTLSVL